MTGPPHVPPSPSGRGLSRLVVEVRPHPDAEPIRWTLRCDPPGGDHPDPVGACAAIADARAPFDPVPADRPCAQVWSGPERALVTGTWAGRPVHAEFRRTDACQEKRWRALTALLQPSAASSGSSGSSGSGG